jgi:hypothetical protein
LDFNCQSISILELNWTVDQNQHRWKTVATSKDKYKGLGRERKRIEKRERGRVRMTIECIEERS